MKTAKTKIHLLSVCFCLLFSAAALAIDSDGDGVENSADAFPNNPEATTDTDGDGKPDSINLMIFADSFETGNFTAGGWTLGGTMSGTPWTITSYGGGNGKVAKLSQNTTCLLPPCKTAYIQKSVTVPSAGATVGFALQGNVGVDWGPADFYIDGVLSQRWTSLGNWTPVTKTLSAGTHVLKWLTSAAASGGYVYIDEVVVTVNTSLVEDTDDDNDGVLDINDAFPLNAAESIDTDNDGIGNNTDWDDDNDTVPDNVDVAPLNAADTSEITLPIDSLYKGMLLKDSQMAQ